MRFHQARQGRAAGNSTVSRFHAPRASRAAVCVIGAGIAYSHFFYPVPQKPLNTERYSRVSRGSIAHEKPLNLISGPSVTVINEAPIRVRTVRGESGEEAEARMLWAVRFLMGIANGAAQ